MYKYKLVRLSDPQNREAPKKWYAAAKSSKSLSTKAVTRIAAENTTLSSIEMEAAIELLGRCAIEQLQQGHIVQLGSLGSLRITFQSDGVEELEEFDARTMIRSPRVVFRPGREFRERVLRGLRFQNGGVREDGIDYSSPADYRRAKGLPAGDGGEAT